MSSRSEREFMRKAFPSPMDPSYYQTRVPTAGFKLFDECDMEGRLVLDLGAFAGYVGRVCEARGARAILIDIFGTAFPRGKPAVEGDKENLPFPCATFDFVVTNDTLHHGDMERTSGEIHRILKTGGVFISTREPCIGSWENEQAVLKKDCPQQLADGLDERRPHIGAYRKFCAGFRESAIFSCYPWGPARDANYGGEGIAIRCQR